MIGIYKITSLSGRVYIGQSTDIEYRFNSYKKLRCKSQKRLYASFNFYGIEAHTFEVIEECDIELLNERERYWQEYYNVLNKGLNCRLTTSINKSGKMSQDTRIKMKDNHWSKKEGYESPRKGKKHSEESKKKMSEAQKNKYENGYICHNKGRKHTEETKRKNSEAQKNKYENGYVSPMKGKEVPIEQKEKISNTLKRKHKEGEIVTWCKGKKTNIIPFNAKLVLDTEIGIFYNSAKEAFEYNEDYLKVGYSMFKRKLRGANPNNTKFQYV
jgi:group I intron endonuclease